MDDELCRSFILPHRRRMGSDLSFPLFLRQRLMIPICHDGRFGLSKRLRRLMRGFSPSTLGPAFSTVVFKLKCLVVRSQKEGISGRELGAVSLMTPLTLVRNCYVYRHAPLDHTFFALAPFTTPRRTCPTLSRVFWVQGPRNPPSLRPPSSCPTFVSLEDRIEV